MTTALAAAAASLAIGESASFPVANWNDGDDYWMGLGSSPYACVSRWWYDPQADRCVAFFKGASGARATIIEYDLATDTWSRPWGPAYPWQGESAEVLGHPWEAHAFDPATGTLYYREWKTRRLRGWRRTMNLGRADPWPVIHDPALGADPHTTSVTWHPNLFGAGAGGFVVHGGKTIRAFSPSTGEITTLLSGLPVGYPEAGVYVPGLDAVIVGGGDKPAGPFWRVMQGPVALPIQRLADSDAPPPRTDTGPHVPATHYSRLVVHPEERTVMLLANLGPDYPDEAGVWLLDASDWTWRRQSQPHPFGRPEGEQTEKAAGDLLVVTLPRLGILWALSNPGGYQLSPVSRIWRP